MKVYFDESYPHTQEIMILGSLFLSNEANKYLHKEFLKLRAEKKYNKELKYSKIRTKKDLEFAKEAISLFLKSKMPYYRASILPYNEEGLKSINGENVYSKRVTAYSHSAKGLVLDNLLPNQNADLIMDREDRIARSKFKDKILKAKAALGGKVVSVAHVDSRKENTNLVQICDILTGAILQNLRPSKGTNGSGKRKRELGEYYKKETGINDFKVKRIKTKKGKIKIYTLEAPNLQKKFAYVHPQKRAK